MDSPKKQRSGPWLALAFEGSRLEGGVVRLSGSHLTVQNAFSVALSLDPFTHDPELVGREIRNQLDAAGVREKRCSVCVSQSLALSFQVQLPELTGDDLNSFLTIEAEKGFPYAPEALLISRSIVSTPRGEKFATMVAIPREQIERLETVLKAARLSPATFSLGVTALQGADLPSSNGVIAVCIGDETAGMQITCGGGIAALRILEGAFDMDGPEKQLQADIVAREIRITLGQLPEAMRDGVRRLRIFGRSELRQQLARQIQPAMQILGVTVEVVEAYAPADMRIPFQIGVPVSAAVSLAGRQVAGQGSLLEFLPPRVTYWKQFSQRYSSKRLFYGGATAAAAALVVGGLFGYQQFQLMQLEKEWLTVQPGANKVDDIQAQLRKYRPWFSGTQRSLSILRDLTKAFPEDGTVTAKTITIRDRRTVICMGTAKDNQALLKAVGQLRNSPDVADVNVDSMQGKSPMQFSFTFHWGEGGSDEH